MAAIDANTLAERLDQLNGQELWVHLEAEGPLEKYPAKHHARRVLENLGAKAGLLYLPGQPARNNEDSDMPAPFRQRRYFYYLSGCNEPGCYLTYDIQRDHLALFIPRVNPERVIWNGRGSTPAEALDKYDIDEVYFEDELQSFIQAWVMYNRGNVYILHESQGPQMPYFPIRLDTTALQPAMDVTRQIKDDHEISLIRKANNISSEAHRQVLANVLRFKNEAQVEGLFLDVCISKQAKEQAYDPIAASGPNAGTLHYDANNEDFEDRQLMCLDAGCEYELYASDITRTFPLSGSWPSSEAENIYKLVQRMQESCISKLKPGVRYLDLHVFAHQIAIDGLLRLGILHNGTREEIYKAGTSRAFFPHGLGHHVGLEVHDVGQRELMSLEGKKQTVPSLYPEDFHLPVYDENMCHAPADPQSPHLQEGMVVTVEPGIYFSMYALSYFYLPSPIHSKYINTQVLGRYMPVGGVRIEDDILITSKGYENLTTAPKGEEMLMIIQSGSTNAATSHDSVRRSRARRSEVKPKRAEDEPLFRAPGIPKPTAPKPIAKAPTETQNERRSPDFEPFDGPSLFSGFKCSTNADEKVTCSMSPSRVLDPPAAPRKEQTPICGEPSLEFQHVYVSRDSQNHQSISRRTFSRKPQCRACGILVESLNRLRDTLMSKQAGHDLRETKEKERVTPPIGMSSTEISPEMAQIHRASREKMDKARTVDVSPPPITIPSYSRQNIRCESQRGAMTQAATAKDKLPQYRSATIDSYFESTRSSAPKLSATASSPWSVPNLPPPPPSYNVNEIFAPKREVTIPRPAASRGLAAAVDRERETQRRPLSFTRTPGARRSIPALRPAQSVPSFTSISASDRLRTANPFIQGSLRTPSERALIQQKFQEFRESRKPSNDRFIPSVEPVRDQNPFRSRGERESIPSAPEFPTSVAEDDRESDAAFYRRSRGELIPQPSMRNLALRTRDV